MDILGTLQKLSMESGFAAFFVTDGGWKNLIMIIIAFVLLYLGIVKKFEPLLLCGIAFGCLLTNLSYFIGMGENALYHPELWEAFLDEASPYYHSYGHVMSNAGLLGGVVMYYASGKKINPLIGSAGVSAVPMAARVSQDVGRKYNKTNFLLMHAMGPNVAGVIGSAIAAGFLLSVFGG